MDLAQKERKLAESGLGVRLTPVERMRTAVKKTLRRVLGDGVTASIHAVEHAVQNLRGVPPKVDKGMWIIPHAVKPGDVVVDVGANGADWAYSMSRRVGPQGKVFSFEANPYYARVTRRALDYLRCRNVNFFGFGLSDRDGEGQILVENERGEEVSGTGFIVEGEPSKRTATIALRTLDGLAREYPELMRAAFVKCDVEGHEPQVIDGALGVLKAARPVVISEVGAAYLGGHPEDHLFRVFAGLDYTCFGLGPDRRLWPSRDHTDMPAGHNVDRLFVPAERVCTFADLLKDGPAGG